MAHKKIERKKELDRRRKHQGPHSRSSGCCQEQQVSLAIFLVPEPRHEAADAPRRFRCFSFVRIPGNRQVFRLFCQ